MLSLESLEGEQKMANILISLGALGCDDCFVSNSVKEGSEPISWHNVLQIKEMLDM